MKVIIKRTYFNDATIGILTIDSIENPIFHTIERPWLDNVHKISCIPEGTYKVITYSSPDHDGVWQICDAPNRDHILIHSANWVDQLEGCIAPGLSFGYMYRDGENKKAVLNSAQAISQLKTLIGYPSEFELVILS